MKNIILAIVGIAIAIGLVSYRSNGSQQKNANEVQTIFGATVTTANMHNTSIGGPYNPNEYREFANSWFKHYTLTVSAPNGWHFTGEPYINCVRDDQGAFAWNNFPAAKDRVVITQRGPNYIVVSVWAGSRSIAINLACQATKD